MSLMTIQEAAAMLRIHPQTLRRWCKQGLIPYARRGRAYRFNPDDVKQTMIATETPKHA